MSRALPPGRVQRGRGMRGALLRGAVLTTLAVPPACLAQGEPLTRLSEQEEDGGPPPPPILDASVTVDAPLDALVTDPHLVSNVDPPHGPFTGGRQATIRGNGFAGAVQVWFGDARLADADVLPLDGRRIQVTVPPGPPGPVDVTVQNGTDASTRRTLPGGYTFDAFYATPDEGPTGGGTVITLRGQGTAWGASTTVRVGLKACTSVTLLGPQELTCVVPADAAGMKSITVTTGTDELTVLDAFTHGDSDDGFRGGLSGGDLAGRLRVLVLDDFRGVPLRNAWVVLGESLATARVERTDATGLVVVEDPSLVGGITVTAAQKCFQPQTFVDVPVDTVTVYLSPIMSPSCIEEGDPPPSGGSGSGSGGSGTAATGVAGELVWANGNEFQRAIWKTVPGPMSPDEEQTAYVFRLSTDPTGTFYLPERARAVTRDSPGGWGYEYTVDIPAGNHTLYALAGIENRAVSPAQFTAYAMGVVRGVSVKPGQRTLDIAVPMSLVLDQALDLAVIGPQPTPRGPDLLTATVTVQLGELGYILLPAGKRVVPLPTSDLVSVVGLPVLEGPLAHARFVTTATAATGATGGTPRSALGLYGAVATSAPLALDRFVEIPTLITPAPGTDWSGTELDVGWAPGGGRVDLIVTEVDAGGGLVTWSIVAPADRPSIGLPDLRSLDPDLALPPGPLSISIAAAQIDAFDYGEIRYRTLTQRAWMAYGRDVLFASLPP